MASLLPEIPLWLMDPRQKYPLMNWLVQLGLPSRVRRDVLAQWGSAMGVDISATDYNLLDRRMVTSPAPPAVQ